MSEVSAHPKSRAAAVSNSRLFDTREAEAAIQSALSQTGYGELRRLQVECSPDAVTISGRVPTYYLKQLAQSVIQDVPGISRVRNEIHVC